jgi:hypothetical protein
VIFPSLPPSPDRGDQARVGQPCIAGNQRTLKTIGNTGYKTLKGINQSPHSPGFLNIFPGQLSTRGSSLGLSTQSPAAGLPFVFNE